MVALDKSSIDWFSRQGLKQWSWIKTSKKLASCANSAPKGFLGDPTRAQTLRAAGLLDAQILVVALDHPAACLRLVKLARRARPSLRIISRAYDRNQAFALYKAGADDIVRETFDTSLRAGRYSLENLGLTDYEPDELAKTFYQRDREAMQDLAKLWDPKF